MRGTIHLVTARRLSLLRPRDPAGLRSTAVAASVTSRRSCAASIWIRWSVRGGPLLPRSRGRGTELRAILAERFPELDAAALALRLPDAAGVRAGAARAGSGDGAHRAVDDGGVVARPAARADALDRVGRAALPRGVRPGVGRGRDDVVPADRHARGRRAAAAAARTVPRRARPRALRPSGRTAARSRHAGAGALPARVRQRPALARRPQPVRLGARSRSARAGVDGRLGLGAPRRPRARRSGGWRPTASSSPRPAVEEGGRLGRGGGTTARALPRARRATCGWRPSAAEAGAATRRARARRAPRRTRARPGSPCPWRART